MSLSLYESYIAVVLQGGITSLSFELTSIKPIVRILSPEHSTADAVIVSSLVGYLPLFQAKYEYNKSNFMQFLLISMQIYVTQI
jgi:hypothetical protein